MAKKKLSLFKKAYFAILKDGYKRADYLRKHELLESIGENVYYYSRYMPADPKYIKLGNNVIISANVRFINHDRVDLLLKGMYQKSFKKYFGKIEVGNNVLFGADVLVLPGVTIGDNCIIGAGAVVTKDLESGYVYAGVPAKQIGKFEDFINKRMDYYK